MTRRRDRAAAGSGLASLSYPACRKGSRTGSRNGRFERPWNRVEHDESQVVGFRIDRIHPVPGSVKVGRHEFEPPAG